MATGMVAISGAIATATDSPMVTTITTMETMAEDMAMAGATTATEVINKTAE